MILFLKIVYFVICFVMCIIVGSDIVVYSVDFSYIFEFILFMKDVDFFICECNMYVY